MADVFISYSRKDSDFARQLVDDLIRHGKVVWVDWDGIPLTSPDWWVEIKTGIESADSFVFNMSPHSLASVVCHLELDYALELEKRIIPIVIEDITRQEAFASLIDYQPDQAMAKRLQGKQIEQIASNNWQVISNINWLFSRWRDDYLTTFDNLIDVLETDLDYVKSHTRYLIRAAEWQRNNRRSDLLLFGDEIDLAEAWLEKGTTYTDQAKANTVNNTINPLPVELHDVYIRESRIAQQRRTRIFQLVGVVTVIAVMIGLGTGVLAWDSQRRFTLAITAEAEAIGLRSTVVFEATVFRVRQDRNATQVAGLGLIPELDATRSPHDIITEATAIATRTQWEPVIQTFDDVEMVKVPAGCFYMGDFENLPVHEVCLDSFWIDRTEVTYGQVAVYDFPTPIYSPFPDNSDPSPDHPRVLTTWFDAIEICALRDARLPTEAEWEYAARGFDSLRYPWGNDWEDNRSVNDYNRGDRRIYPVGLYPEGASWVGALDMSGNAEEWTSSLYKDYPYDATDGREDLSDDSQPVDRVVRGAVVGFPPEVRQKSTFRTVYDAESGGAFVGVRCVRDLSETGE